MTSTNVKQFSVIRCLFRDCVYFLKNMSNIFRLKIRFKNSSIRFPLQISYSNINNIYLSDKVFLDSSSILRIIDNCRLFIGEGTTIGPFCHISGTKNKIIIGKDVLIAPRAYISTTNRRYDQISIPVIKQGYTSKGDVIIGDGSWIGIGSSILSGVHIGKHSIIGANSVVTSNIPPYSVAVGSPARVIKKYSFTEKKWLTNEQSRI